MEYGNRSPERWLCRLTVRDRWLSGVCFAELSKRGAAYPIQGPKTRCLSGASHALDIADGRLGIAE